MIRSPKIQHALSKDFASVDFWVTYCLCFEDSFASRGLRGNSRSVSILRVQNQKGFKGIMKKISSKVVTLGVLGSLGTLAAACGSSTTSSTSSTNWAMESSAMAGGGMNALIAAAQKEGTLTVTTLPANWANYGTIMADFTKKYGIKIKDVNPNGSSAYELSSIKSLKNSSRGPDVVDVGPSFALAGDQAGLFAPYQVSSWNQLPSTMKQSNGDWYYDYGGYIAIGYNAGVISVPPTRFADLTNPEFKGGIALDGNPTQAGAAFGAVYAAALANGGSLDNIQPGVDFFKHLSQIGNFIPVAATPAAIESGQVKATIDWDYLQVAAQQAVAGKVDWKVVVPSDGLYASYYAQAISKYAPHPAAARLWEEFLYSSLGQNLFLQGFARPAELTAMTTAGTVNQGFLATLPAVSGTATFPTQSQLTAAQQVVLSNWASVSG